MRALILASALCPIFAQTPSGLPKGEVVPRVVCTANPRFSYALYLPSGYREDRPWPVLYGFSPIGSGEEPVQLFRQAAERFGWIVVGSNDSRNGPLRPALEASEAVWKDVRSRFQVDPRRSYATGLSGGARMALRLALKHPKQFAGLVSFGAFGTGEGLLTGLGHLRFYLGCGLEDFNHWEVLEGRRELQSRGWEALADRFEGGHQRAPEETAMAALSYLQLGAAQRGLAPKEQALEEEFRRCLELNGEKAGSSLLALRRWQELAALFPDSPEGQRAAKRAATLEKDASVLEERRFEQDYEAASRELHGSAHYREDLTRHINRLKSASPAEQLMIRRLLGAPILNYRMALGVALEKKSWAQLLTLSTTLAALDEREGWPCIYAAAALTQLGRPSEAITHLRAAQIRGYRKPERIRALEELKPLHGHGEFEAILKGMGAEPSR